MRRGLMILAAVVSLGMARVARAPTPVPQRLCYVLVEDRARGIGFALCIFPLPQEKVPPEYPDLEA